MCINEAETERSGLNLAAMGMRRSAVKGLGTIPAASCIFSCRTIEMVEKISSIYSPASKDFY